MAQEFLERLEALLGKLTSAGFKDVKLECKHFFSGAAVYADGTICMSWTPVGFAMKLPEKLREELVAERGAKSPLLSEGPHQEKLRGFAESDVE